MGKRETVNINEPSHLYKVPELVRVARNELTCLECGDIVPPGLNFCPRCSSDVDAPENTRPRIKTRMAPTVSYLKEGEYQIV